ncbi:putative polysaccharide deacetylase [Lyophyllum shimeji]|uniref:chitin deacetylase n=1 Tax=Lyophyllum shimeji TaxID=47721 RepID=A0A9P3PUL2_LYOSH|nr:putative polysaccharide deacetylase [Lyophyllum shimeji]
MRSCSLATLVALLGASNVQAVNHRHVDIVHKRQATANVAAAVSTTSARLSGTATGVTAVPVPTVAGIPALDNITFGMPSGTTLPVTTTFAAGASPPVSGAPALPTPFVFSPNDWPAQDHIPPTDSDEVAQWMKELEGLNIPNIKPTVDGSCQNDTAAAADAANRGWWTCGGYTRPTDIVACPDKYTWGVSFDDGPAPYTQYALTSSLRWSPFLTTPFVQKLVEIPGPEENLCHLLRCHEISVHTWSHKHLTSLTNEQVVAELGWTRHAIRTVLGVTPTTMRPPFGDIDDRVRAISLAMGMVPIMWTRTPDGGQFDTNDWRVAGGLVTGKDSYATFQNILTNASAMDTGFIVLQHDLYEITVDLATGYTLDAALNHNPPFTLKPIGQCTKTPTANLYFESNKNATFPMMNHTYDIDGDGVAEFGKSSKNAGFRNSAPLLGALFLAGIGAILL